jgi:hypothetical protein
MSSSNHILYKYRVFCTTDSQNEFIWLDENDSEPTTCPVNTAHTIDGSKTTIVDSRKPETFRIKEESTPTGEHFMCETKVINTDANDTSENDYSWPYPISILAVYMITTSDHEGDNFEAMIAPNTTIGTITSDVSANDTVITVSQTVIDNTSVGYYVTLDDGTNSDNLGHVLAIDKVAKTLTVETAAVNSFSAATPTYVKQTVYYLRNYEFGPAWEYVIGESKIGASYMPANTVLRARYTENSGTNKKLVVKFEYLY